MVEDFVKDIEAKMADGASGSRNDIGLFVEMPEEKVLEPIIEEVPPSNELILELPPEADFETVPDSKETVIYESVKTYLYKLNNDMRYRRVTEDEKNLLDRAFDFVDVDHTRARNLVNAFMDTLVITEKRIPEKKLHQM